MKFHTHHFPAGTIFVLNDEMYHYSTSKVPGEEFEVTKVVRNGPNSYVLETTKKTNPEAFSDMNQSYNISHVKTIIKRGDGPVVFEEREFDPRDFMFLEEKHIIENHLNIKTKKTHFVHWSLRDIVMFCIRDRNANGGGIFDIEKCMEAVSKQSFVNFFDTRAYGIGGFSVDKKRLKRFMQQNYNRFLISVKVAQKQQDEIDDKFYGDDYFGSSFGLDEDPIAAEGLDQSKLFPNRQEGSCYDGNDYDYPSSLGEELDGLSMGDEVGELSIKDLSERMAQRKAIVEDMVLNGGVTGFATHIPYRASDEEQNLLTGQPTLDKMMEGGIPTGQLSVFSGVGPTPVEAGIPAEVFEYQWPTTHSDSLLEQLMKNKVDETEKKHEEDM